MLTQFFGNYLLQKNIITSPQLMQALQHKNSKGSKLGSLAVNAGYMTEAEVEDVHNMQTRYDKRFAEIAIHMGYLTSQQAEELLNTQKLGYVMLGNSIITLGFADESVIQEAVASYETEFNLDHTNILYAGQDIVDEMVGRFYGFDNKKEPNLAKSYATLLIKNIIRFVGNDCSLLSPVTELPEIIAPFTSYQDIIGDYNSNTYICGDISSFIAFANRYAGEAFEDDSDFIKESVSDFLNLHNGLFTVNVSNDLGIDLELSPPYADETAPKLAPGSYIIPIEFTFGIIYFIFTA